MHSVQSLRPISHVHLNLQSWQSRWNIGSGYLANSILVWILIAQNKNLDFEWNWQYHIRFLEMQTIHVHYLFTFPPSYFSLGCAGTLYLRDSWGMQGYKDKLRSQKLLCNPHPQIRQIHVLLIFLELFSKQWFIYWYMNKQHEVIDDIEAVNVVVNSINHLRPLAATYY